MQTIHDFLAADHRHCDTLFAQAEAADPATLAASFAAFHQAMIHHLAMEEQVLFPAFEAATGNNMGPTRIMRMEHEQMRELFADMQAAITAGDRTAFSGLAETLLILMQQHNLKEEQMLYPMSDRALGNTEPLIQRMQSIT